MALKETDLEKKSLADIEALILGYEQKSKEIALKVGVGQAKPTDMLAVNSDLSTLRKVRDKKLLKEKKPLTQQLHKSAAPLKSYEDYVKSKKGK
jgi:GTP cyclohydrolase III